MKQKIIFGLLVSLTVVVVFSGITTIDYLNLIDETNLIKSELVKEKINHKYALDMAKLPAEERKEIIKAVQKQAKNQKLV